MVTVLEQITSTVQKLGPSINYGPPVTVGDTQVVPVSMVWLGFGGVDGVDGQGGGGGAGASLPIGAYVDGIDGPEFQPNVIALIAASGILVAAVGSAIAGVISASRRRRGLFR
ncbi:MAG: hypothetical protein HY996_06570 [Micrococcales bacterium]|nr:hypothetical protein [Micrococcales bacterium]